VSDVTETAADVEPVSSSKRSKRRRRPKPRVKEITAGAPASRLRALVAALIGAASIALAVVLPVFGTFGVVEGEPFNSPIWALASAVAVIFCAGSTWVARPSPWHLWGTWPLAMLAATAMIVLGFADEVARSELLPAAIRTAGGVALAAGAYQWARARVRGLLKLTSLDRRQKVKLRTDDDKTKKVAASGVEPDDIVVLSPGDDVPVDGVVVNGSGFVDESRLTGAEIPVAKRPGDPVFAGSVTSMPELVMRVSAPTGRTVHELRAHSFVSLGKRLDRPATSVTVSAAVTVALALVGSATIIAQHGLTQVITWLPLVASVLLATSAVAPAIALGYRRFEVAAECYANGVVPSRARDVDKLGTIRRWQIDPMLLAAPSAVETHLFGQAGEDKLLTVACALVGGRAGPEARSVRESASTKGLSSAQAAATRDSDGGVSWGTVLGARWFLGTLGAVEAEEGLEVDDPVRVRVGQLGEDGASVWVIGRQDEGPLGALRIAVTADQDVAAAAKVLDATVMDGVPDATRSALATAAGVRRDGPPPARNDGALLSPASERPSAGLVVRAHAPEPGIAIPTGGSPRVLAGGVRGFGALVARARRLQKASWALTVATVAIGPLLAAGLALVGLMGPLAGAALGLGALVAALRIESV